MVVCVLETNLTQTVFLESCRVFGVPVVLVGHSMSTAVLVVTAWPFGCTIFHAT